MGGCAIRKCKNHTEKGGIIRLYTFPKNELVAQKWLRYCGPKASIRNSRVCSIHFATSDYIKKPLRDILLNTSPRKVRKLKPDAIPTLHIDDDRDKLNTTTSRLIQLWKTQLGEIVMSGSDEKPTSTASSQALQTTEDDNMKSCWVCFATEADDRLAAWVQPCKCIGTTKWVHQSCLQRWVDEKQRGNITRKVLCPQCKAEYIVVFPSMGAFVALLDAMEEITHKICPFIAGGVLLGSIYWIAITYGAVTVMQVVGHREGLEMMESADPLVLLVLLPTIPVTLISAKMYNWEDSVLLFLRKYCTKIPALGYILPFGNVEGDRGAIIPGPTSSTNINGATAHLSPTRIFCSALLLPTISTIIGKIFFRSIHNNLHRTILGGLTYITFKGALKIYHKQMLYIRHSSRKILDYTESNLKLYRNNKSSTTTDTVSSTRDDSEQVI